MQILTGDVNINYGAIYENFVAQELQAHGWALRYFNSKKQGEVDFVIEGGACYAGSNGPRRGRQKEDEYGGSGAIGNLEFHSPVGEIPWIAMGMMLFLYVFYTKKRKNAQKV